MVEQHLAADELATERLRLGWTTLQLADVWFQTDLPGNSYRWGEFHDDARRADAISRFRKYAYQWY
jgi:hypothetical protein